MRHYCKERERATNLEVGEVVEVQDDQSVVSLTSNDSDLQKKMMKKEEKKKGGWTNAIILLGMASKLYKN